MKFTTEFPTIPGWYWIRRPDGSLLVKEVLLANWWVDTSRNGICIYWEDHSYVHADEFPSLNWEFAGPLTPPE